MSSCFAFRPDPIDRGRLIKKENRSVKTIDRYFRLDKKEIAYFRFILEACDGLAQMTTVDRRSGIVVVCFSPTCRDHVDFIIKGLAREISILPYDPKGAAFENTKESGVNR